MLQKPFPDHLRERTASRRFVILKDMKQEWMKNMKYTTVEELLADEGFMAWFHQTDKTEIKKWDKWIGESTEHQQLTTEAVHFLKRILLVKEKDEITGDQARTMFDRILDTIVTYEEQRRNISIK